MLKNSLVILFAFSFQLAVAQESAPIKTNKTSKKTKINLSFEDEIIQGRYESSDLLIINSRKTVKYQALYTTRQHFMDEVESTLGEFNDYQKK